MNIHRRNRAILALCLSVVITLPSCRRESAEEVESETVVAVKTAPAIVGNIRRLPAALPAIYRQLVR